MALIAFAGGATPRRPLTILNRQRVCGGGRRVLVLFNVCLRIQIKDSLKVDSGSKLFPSLDCLPRKSPR